jgi:hypothetical protein
LQVLGAVEKVLIGMVLTIVVVAVVALVVLEPHQDFQLVLALQSL